MAIPEQTTQTRTDHPGVEGRILDRIRGEYLEMPGLTLNVRQAARLWHLEADHCRQLLEELVSEGFLGHDRRRGLFLRRS